MSEAICALRRKAFLAGVMIVAGLSLSALPTPTGAYDEIKDPKISGAKVADAVATAQVDQVVDSLVSESMGAFKQEELEPKLQVMNYVFDKAISPGRKDLLAEKVYGDSIAIYWYRIAFRGKKEGTFATMYIKTTFNKYIDYWTLTDFDFQSKMADIGLP
jgi:hypothetical protein